MSPDLKYLLLSVLLTAVQVLIAAAAANQVVGLTRLAGNRDGLPEMSGFAGRGKRARSPCSDAATRPARPAGVARRLVPCSIVIGRSVFSRRVKQAMER